jgi:hypothetical protein
MSFSDSLNNVPSGKSPRQRGKAPPFELFDRATGVTHVPPGWYECVVIRGEMVKTKKGKDAYRLWMEVAAGPHCKHPLWRYYTLDTLPAANQAKAALAPLGLRTGADLSRPYPAQGQVVKVRVLVAVQTREDGSTGDDVQRFELISDTPAQANPNAVDPVAVAADGTGDSPTATAAATTANGDGGVSTPRKRGRPRGSKNRVAAADPPAATPAPGEGDS